MQEDIRLFVENEHKGRDQHDEPDRLAQQLQPVYYGHAEERDRDDDDRRNDIAEDNRQAEIDLESLGHNGSFQGKEYEGEYGVDQRCDRRPYIAEARPAREEVHVDVVFARVIGDWQSCYEDESGNDQYSGKGIAEPVAERDRAANRLEREERDAAKGRVGDDEGRPASKRLRSIAKRIVLHGLVRDPGLVGAPRPNRLGGHLAYPLSASPIN